MNKNTSSKLSKKLLKYSSLSLAIAGVADASGQIIYTDVNPDVGGPGVEVYIDFNNDSEWDALITRNLKTPTDQTINALFVAPRDGNAILGSTSIYNGSTYRYPFALNSGYIISSGNTNWNSSYYYQSMNWGSCNYPNSNWCNVTDKFLGIRFKINGNTHFGWARLDVINASNWILKDYAYNSTPGEPIEAGQQTLSTNIFDENKTRIVALNKTIGLYNLPGKTEFSLYSMTGQQVLNGETNYKMHTIEANYVATGVYIIELKDVNSKAITRKKVVL